MAHCRFYLAMKIRIFDDLYLLQRIDHLIRTRATGTPAQLARRLNTCERDVYRLLADLRDQGFPIAYDKQSDTYYYMEQVKLDISIVVGSEKLLTIRGGEKRFNFFERLTKFGSQDSFLWRTIRFVIWLLPFSFSNICNAQNIVPNPSFESINFIDNRWSGTYRSFEKKVVDWDSPNNGSPDLLSTDNCNKMYPKRDELILTDCTVRSGKIMVGIKTFGCRSRTTHCKEYIQCELLEPMEPGKNYRIEFWLKLVDGSVKTNNLGISLSTHKVRYASESVINFLTPKYNIDTIIDTYNWIRVNTTYRSDSNYAYLLIGNFYSDDSTKSVNDGNSYSFILIDDISIVPSNEYLPGNIETGKIYILKNINYETDKFVLTDSTYTQIDSIARILQENMTLKIKIIGHTDDLGGKEYNMRLSQKRAKEIEKLLLMRQINKDRIIIEAKGDSHPLIKDKSPLARQANRRVEFIFLNPGE